MSRETLTGSSEPHEIARLRAGDHDAVTGFIRRHGPRIQAVASRFLRRERDRNSAVQETFKRAFAAFDAWDDAGAVEPRLHRWVLEACLRHLESTPPGPTVDLESLLPRFDQTGHRVMAAAASTQAPRSEHEARACIDRLPADHRTVLLLRDVEGLDAADTARLTGRTALEVQLMLHRARQAVLAMTEEARAITPG